MGLFILVVDLCSIGEVEGTCVLNSPADHEEGNETAAKGDT